LLKNDLFFYCINSHFLNPPFKKKKKRSLKIKECYHKYLFQKGKIEFENITSKLDLTFFFSDDPDGDFFLEIEYSADLFHKNTISKYFNVYLTILSQVIDSPEKPICHLEIVAQAEREALLFRFNQPIKNIKEKQHPRPHSPIICKQCPQTCYI